MDVEMGRFDDQGPEYMDCDDGPQDIDVRHSSSPELVPVSGLFDSRLFVVLTMTNRSATQSPTKVLSLSDSRVQVKFMTMDTITTTA